MFIKDACKNIAFYARNQISGMQHDWGRFKRQDAWKPILVVYIAEGIFASVFIVSGLIGVGFFYHYVRAYASPLFIIAIIVGLVGLAVHFTWYSIRIDAKVEEEKNIKEFCE